MKGDLESQAALKTHRLDSERLLLLLDSERLLLLGAAMCHMVLILKLTRIERRHSIQT